MADFTQFMMTDPMMQQGLAAMRGESPSAGLERARYAQTMMAEQQERQRAEQTRAALGQAMAGGITPEKINEIMAIDPEMGLKLLEHMRLQQQQDRLLREQQMMESLVSGGGAGQMSDAGAYILSGSENPILRGVGEKQLADIKTQQEMDREARKEAQQIEKERRNATIAGFELKEGLVPAAPVVNEATKKATALSTYRAKKKSILDMIDKYGDAEILAPSSAKLIKQQFADIRNLERELGNTGVLNVGELPFLEETYASFNPLELTNRTVPKDVLRKNAEQYFNDRESMLTGQLGQMGYIDKSATPPTVDLSTMSLEQLEAERARLLQGGN